MLVALRLSSLVLALLPLASASLEHRVRRSSPHAAAAAHSASRRADAGEASKAGSCIAASWSVVEKRSFDYVIVGAGTAGLTLAGRLSEDKDVNVLVIEAGAAGYGAEADAKLLTPNAAYYNSASHSSMDWNLTSTPQAGLADRSVTLPRGRVVGGSSAVNGLFYVTASSREHQAWARLADDRENWGWHNFRDSHKKSTTYKGNSVKELNTFIAAANVNGSVGTNGPVSVAYPARSYATVTSWIPTFEKLGVKAAASPYDGETHGAYIAASTIDPASWTRSFSRTAYVDPVCSERNNLVILPDQTVARVVFDAKSDGDRRRATGVEFSAGKDKPRVTASAKRQVILSAGALGTPQILQRSGVGRKELLSKYKIDVVKDLPGVGSHLQDHLAVTVQHKAKADLQLPASSDDVQLNSYVDAAVAYLTIDDLFGKEGAKSFLERAKEHTTEYIKKTDATDSVKKGYREQVDLLINDLLPSKSSNFTGHAKPAVEILLSTMNGRISITAAVQAPFSRGYIHIKSADAFGAIDSIDAGYLSHNSDLELLAVGVVFARKLAAQSPLKELIESEASPGAGVTSGVELAKWIRSAAGTNYHPTSSAAMASAAKGGVVDAKLRVHGTSHLRIVDASVVPVSLSAHTQSTAYAIGEIAAELLKSAREASSNAAAASTSDAQRFAAADDDDEECDEWEDEEEDDDDCEE